MASVSLSRRFEPAKLMRLADGLAVATAISVPWSTSATLILMALWLIALIPTLSWAEVRRELLTPAGGLPVLLVVLGVAGMLWADVSLHERWKGLDSFLKLLVIPLLFIQFRRSDNAERVLGGFALSCVVLLVASYVMVLWPHPVRLFSNDFGVPVKSGPSQSGEFVTCIFGFTYLAYDAVVRRQWRWMFALAFVMLAMLANILFVATSRTALLIIFVLLALFALKQLRWRDTLILFAATAALLVVAWFSSPYLRERTTQAWTDYQSYVASDARNSSGERIEFAKRSIAFIKEAPFIGHGTGTIPSLFAKATAGQDGAMGSMTTNPHNQTFAVAIQLGLLGALVLWAMWLAHLWLFRSGGLIEWIGLVLVVQNIVGSLLNSHLFDFLQGWIYVIGVGVAGGAALKRRAADTQRTP
ncbi:O-antigen ligase domain-containing protein [Pseudolabrys taiwanensis]|uniref:O-antigen ligase domain-containing protein n=1 Tax=Pseudolabrys taiwanensis TaxID=331696 RepID=A0A346A3M5_9HYPH|nr:O-antigen ligase family protein [Pseudolabrys taiwanensis]AXK83772.1 O-antigen ligase domain-containing protein [Pseudolabrys taiwanensis]